MHIINARRRSVSAAALALLAGLAVRTGASAATPGQDMIEHLQQRFGLKEGQVRGALGALLVYVRDRLPEPEFKEFAASIPNADHIMQQVKLQGVVTRPLDDREDYEDSLASVGIGQPLASQFAPAVVEYLGAAGFDREQSMLQRVLY